MVEIEKPIMDYVRGLDAERNGGIGPDTKLLEMGLLDSINLVQLIQFLEERFGVTIPDEEIGPTVFESPATISAYVTRRLS